MALAASPSATPFPAGFFGGHTYSRTEQIVSPRTQAGWMGWRGLEGFLAITGARRASTFSAVSAVRSKWTTLRRQWIEPAAGFVDGATFNQYGFQFKDPRGAPRSEFHF